MLMVFQDIARLYAKAGAVAEHDTVMKAFEIANEIAEYANNMMTAGRISGFGVKTKNNILAIKIDSKQS